MHASPGENTRVQCSAPSRVRERSSEGSNDGAGEGDFPAIAATAAAALCALSQYSDAEGLPELTNLAEPRLSLETLLQVRPDRQLE